MFTSCWESQLSAGNYGIKWRPEVITHGAPPPIPTHLHTTLVGSSPTYQSDISIPAGH